MTHIAMESSAGVISLNTSDWPAPAIGLVRRPLRHAVRSAWAAKSIRFDGWGGSVSEAFRKHAFKPFTKATGIEVIDGEFGDMNSYLTRVKASYPRAGNSISPI
jgi:spermidine/putrescine transport system substrate-binding protein